MPTRWHSSVERLVEAAVRDTDLHASSSSPTTSSLTSAIASSWLQTERPPRRRYPSQARRPTAHANSRSVRERRSRRSSLASLAEVGAEVDRVDPELAADVLRRQRTASDLPVNRVPTHVRDPCRVSGYQQDRAVSWFEPSTAHSRSPPCSASLWPTLPWRTVQDAPSRTVEDSSQVRVRRRGRVARRT
jgi:hypothetical protein